VFKSFWLPHKKVKVKISNVGRYHPVVIGATDSLPALGSARYRIKWLACLVSDFVSQDLALQAAYVPVRSQSNNQLPQN
jgi:hypothetical protein